MIRKTAKYYREALKNNPSEELLKEIVIKYGEERDIYLADVEFNWNHCIKGLCFGKDKRLYFRVYWQGDSTDGDVYVLVSDVRRGRAFVPAEHEVFDNRTYERHGDINVVREEYDNAIKALIDYLSPAAIKERKAARLAYDALDVIDKELRPEYLKTHYLGDRYWKARGETCDYVKKHAAEMFKLSDAEFRNRVAEVFYANLKMKQAIIGDTIRIVKMNDALSGARYNGREGVVEGIDSLGQLHGTWGGLAVLPEEDEFIIIKQAV